MRKWVLWGHHFAEYQGMFSLNKPINNLKILEFACGATTLNQELSAKNIGIRSIDPWFEQDISAMELRFRHHLQYQLQRIEQHPDFFDFSRYGGQQEFIARRLQGLEDFFKDYPLGWQQQRYLGLDAQVLPFAPGSFDLTLCSNYFFADLPEQDLTFHLHWFQEIMRVSKELRVYPLTDQQGNVSELLGPVLLALQTQGYQVSVEEVVFRLLPASKAMLRIKANSCRLSSSI